MPAREGLHVPPVSLVLASGSMDRSREASVAGVVTSWFGSPFWGAPPRRPLQLDVRPAPARSTPLPELARLADVLRAGAVPAPPTSITPALVDLAGAAGSGVVGGDDLASDALLEVRGSSGPPRTVPGVAGLLALLLLRRLDVVVGEGVLRAVRGDGLTVRSAPGWGPGLPAPAHLLLPTAAGAALRAYVGALPGPLVVPPVAYMAIVGHLAGTSVEVRAGRAELLGWLEQGTVTRGPVPRLRPHLAVRLAAVAAVRRALLPLAAVAGLLPVRVPRRTVRWPLRLLSGALGTVPAASFADAPARRLVRGA